VELGDNAKYVVKGVGTTSFQLQYGNSLHMNYVLFVPGLRKNPLSISTFEDKGYRFSFVDGQVLLLPKDSNIDGTKVNGVREGGLYKLSRHPTQTLIHDNTTYVIYGMQYFLTYIKRPYHH
jgi:hypothetical protein